MENREIKAGRIGKRREGQRMEETAGQERVGGHPFGVKCQLNSLASIGIS